MLSEKEKQEMLADGLSQQRREDFRKGQLVLPGQRSFDDYIQFLNDLQKVFSPFIPSRTKTSTRLNKL